MKEGAEKKVESDQEMIAKLDKADMVAKKWMDGEPYTLGTALNGMSGCLHDMLRNFTRLGRYAMAIQEMSPERQFQKIMREKFDEPGIVSLETIFRSMRVARFASEKGLKVSYFSELPKMKQLMLTAAGEDDIGDDGSIFGLSESEIKSANLKDLKKIIEKQKASLLDAEETIAKGKEQVGDLREQVKGLRDRTKVLNATEEDTRVKLQKDADLIRGILDSLADQVVPSKLTPAQLVLIRAHVAAVDALVETWCDEIQRKLQN